MIKHIVMWRVRGEDDAARARNAARVKSAFESLRGRIPGLLSLEVGVDDSRVAYACDVVLYSEFASRQALADYAEHPEHQRVRASLGDLRSERHQVDYEATDDEATDAAFEADPPPRTTPSSPHEAVGASAPPPPPRIQPNHGDNSDVQAMR